MPAPIIADIAWVARGEFCEPETVLALPDRTLLVSNVCNFRERGNGFLSLLDFDGRVIDWRLVDGLDAPLGMALAGERLYVVDANRVRVFRWPGYDALEIIAVATQVANYIAVGPDGSLFVSDTARGLVLHRRPDGTQSILTGFDPVTFGFGDPPGWRGSIGVDRAFLDLFDTSRRQLPFRLTPLDATGPRSR